MHKVFITYHHENDQDYKDQLVALGERHGIFIDRSVDTGDISDDLTDEAIRTKIRDEYLRDSTVTIVLVGTETKKRKHIDWEIYSSMYDGVKNKKSGILVINLPHIDSKTFKVAHENEKERIYPEITDWSPCINKLYLERQFPYVPDRIIDNLQPEAYISITNWNKICNPSNLYFLIDATFNDRARCEYDLSRPMKRHNS